MSKKKLLIPVALIVLGLAASHVMAKPPKAPKLKIQGTLYVMPQSFLLNLNEGHYAKLSVALELAPGQSTGAAAAGASSSGSGESAGTLPEEPAIREIVTNAVTGQSGSTLVSASGRSAIKHQILMEIKHHTDVKVESVLFPEVTVQ
ncbi:MAG TPA: flagellar basal body-associated FliL family protein [Solirubrobacteraceae bacterium]|jgi:flagellar basal body-associated protein FliL|nr:flagellar basal body-associated FliL family protein [Solirubrobacteraceae bacterium]